jgi:predicted Zn-dependent protease
MPTSPIAVPFKADKTKTPEVRVAEALEFIAARMAGIERDLTIMRADLRAMATRAIPL